MVSEKIFSFGSNLSLKRMRINNKSAKFFAYVYLPNHKFTFEGYSNLWKGAVANIIPSEKNKVYGIVYEIDVEDLANLDKQESNYNRFKLEVNKVDSDEKIECWTYEQKKNSLASEFKEPSLRYKKLIIDSAKENNFPEYYLNMLLQFKDNGIVDCGPVELDR